MGLSQEYKHTILKKVKKSDYAQTKERINKNAQQMLEICRANGCTVLEVQASVDLLLSYIKQTKV